jgi:hypothetical protein
MPFTALLTSFAVSLLLMQTAYAQRPGNLTPEAPVASAEPAFNRAAFSSAYAKAGRPAIVVLWNRELTDMLQHSRPVKH